MEDLSHLIISIKKRTETEGIVRTRPVVRSVETSNVIAYMISAALHYCYSCGLNKDLTLFLCKEAVQKSLGEYSGSKENTFDYLRVQSSVLNAVKEVAQVWVEEGIPSSVEETLRKVTAAGKVDISTLSLTNKRHKQEDRYFAVTDLRVYPLFEEYEEIQCMSGQQPTITVGVLDGHNGAEAAEHCHSLAPLRLRHLLNKGVSVPRALGDIFSGLNDSLNICRNKFRWKSGTTATMCVLRDSMLYTAWVGDSQAWLVRKDGSAEALTDTLHRPVFPEERIDVEERGGFVSTTPGDERVGGVLAVSRGLGDDTFITGVSALPSITAYRLDGEELCLVVASDGLWDMEDCDGDSVGAFIAEKVAEKGMTKRDTIPRMLADRAIRASGTDNITIVMVWLDAFSSCASEGVSESGSSIELEDARSVRRFSRRHSAYVEELSQLRRCPQRLRDNVRRLKDVPPPDEGATERVRRGRSRSVPFTEVQLRFSSPMRVKNLSNYAD